MCSTAQTIKANINLTLWDEDEKEEVKGFGKLFKDEKDDFLGLLSVPVTDILNSAGKEILERWYPLRTST
jgi:hypothetical protein